jgi:tetratricopeptide (TPR) repeat protein
MDLLDTLGLIQMSKGDFSGAEASLTRSRSQREALYRTDHPKIADSYLHAALLSAAQGRKDDAHRLVQRGLEIENALVTGPDGRWALSLLAGAEIYTKIGQFDQAKSCYASAIPVLERELGPDAPRVEIARRRYTALRDKTAP